MPAQPPLLDIAARSSFIQPPVIDMWSDLARRLDQHSTNSASKNVDGLFLEDLRKMCLEESSRTSPCSSLFEPSLTSHRVPPSTSMGGGASSSSVLPTSTTRLPSSQIQPNLLTLATSTNNSRLKTSTSPNRQPQQHQYHLQQQQVIEDTNQGLLWQQLAGLSLEDILPYNRLKTR